MTLADRLKAAGYATGMVGKWHLGSDRKFHPLNRGFQNTTASWGRVVFRQ
jgi:arylsulfatase A-like enzyme